MISTEDIEHIPTQISPTHHWNIKWLFIYFLYNNIVIPWFVTIHSVTCVFRSKFLSHWHYNIINKWAVLHNFLSIGELLAECFRELFGGVGGISERSFAVHTRAPSFRRRIGHQSWASERSGTLNWHRIRRQTLVKFPHQRMLFSSK